MSKKGIVVVVGGDTDGDITLIHVDGKLKCFDEGLPEDILEVLCPDVPKHTRQQKMRGGQALDYPENLEDILAWEEDP